jgi:hypothetical protein
MKYLAGIIFGAVFSTNLLCGFSQQIYFNNIYNLCATYDPEAWSVGITAIETGDSYVISGAAVDTADFWMRRITFLKIDNNGNSLWNKEYGENIDDYYIGGPGSLLRWNSGNYYFSGSINHWQPTNYDVGLLMKLDNQFDTIWTKKYDLNLDGQNDTSVIFSQLDICTNGDLIFGGSMNGSNLLLWRTDSLGATKWYKTFHYGNNTLCTGYSVIQTTDGGFALGGYKQTITHPPTGDPIIVKTDSLGNQEWVKYLGGPYLDNKAMLSRSPDGNIIMGTAYAESMTGDIPKSRIYIVKLDNSGNIIWENKYGASLYSNFLLNIRTLENGSIIASGSCTEVSIYYGWILKVDMNGDSLWLRRERYFEGENSLHYLYDIIPTSDNGFLTCGDAIPISPDIGIRSAWVIKLDSLGCDTAGCDSTVWIDEHGGIVAMRNPILEMWPNPARDRIAMTLPDNISPGIMELTIYNIFGHEVMIWSENISTKIITVDISSLSNGLYFVAGCNKKNLNLRGKFVVVK